MKRNRPDKDGTHRGAFEKNKKKIYATQTVCGICGKPVDFSLKYPHPLSPCIDHIIPIAKGGHPSDIDNMQLAHWTCNRQKSDKLIDNSVTKQDEILGNVFSVSLSRGMLITTMVPTRSHQKWKNRVFQRVKNILQKM